MPSQQPGCQYHQQQDAQVSPMIAIGEVQRLLLMTWLIPFKLHMEKDNTRIMIIIALDVIMIGMA
jgi:hypothetical protein